MRKKLYLVGSILLFLFLLFIVAESQSLKPVFFKLKDIKDVSKTAAADGEVLAYVSSTGLWTPSASAGGAPTTAHYLTDQAESGLSAEVVVTANGKSLVTAANYAAMRTLLDLEVGTDFNAYDADLTTYAGITPSANIQSLLGAATYAAAKTLLTVANIADTTNGLVVTGATDTVTITHDGTNAIFTTTDGVFVFDSDEAAAPGGIELPDDDTNYVSILAQEMAADFAITLPAAVAGGTNYVLNTTGANGILQFSDPTSIIAAASDTVAGKVELATVAETSAGTDATRAVTPDGLAGSVFGTKTMILKVMAEATVVTSGDGKMYVTIPVELNGMNLVSVGAHVYTADSAQNMDIDVYRTTGTAHDMLSTAMRIEANETDTLTSAQPGTIDTSYDDVVTGSVIRIDVTTFTGTVGAGLEIRLGFALP